MHDNAQHAQHLVFETTAGGSAADDHNPDRVETAAKTAGRVRTFSHHPSPTTVPAAWLRYLSDYDARFGVDFDTETVT